VNAFADQDLDLDPVEVARLGLDRVRALVEG